ncbi:MAG: hypothetical protein KIT48_22135 [Pseudolabrys sp.]|nr:hypothetical protein [Pseudolabrys sp.]
MIAAIMTGRKCENFIAAFRKVAVLVSPGRAMPETFGVRRFLSYNCNIGIWLLTSQSNQLAFCCGVVAIP